VDNLKRRTRNEEPETKNGQAPEEEKCGRKSPPELAGIAEAYSALVSEVPDLAATTAGATTIPIKARAIKRSCIGWSPGLEFF